MIVYLHSHDVSDAGRTFGRHAAQDVRHLIVSEGTHVREIATRVLTRFNEEERATPNGLIDLLIINTHGSPGVIHIGGIDDDTNDINIHNARIFAAPFARMMKPARDGGLGVEIHGCGVAGGSINPTTDEVEDGEIGFRFLYALACGFGVNVRASASPQVSDSDGMFEDTLVEAEPSEEADWHGHVFAPSESEDLHSGGFMTRVEALFDEMMRSATVSDPREAALPPR